MFPLLVPRSIHLGAFRGRPDPLYMDSLIYSPLQTWSNLEREVKDGMDGGTAVPGLPVPSGGAEQGEHRATGTESHENHHCEAECCFLL